MSEDRTTNGIAQTEVEVLRRRIAELEQQQAVSQQAATELIRQQQIALDAALDGIALLDVNGVYIYMNQAHAAIHGYDHPEELLGQGFMLVIAEEELARFGEITPILQREGRWRGEVISKRRDGALHPTDTTLASLADGGMVCVVRDLTTQKQAEAERIRLQEAIIQSQAATLAELSTPLIPINEQVMVMPLIGSVDSRRAQQVIDSLLQGIAVNHAQVVILDITGVPVVDTQVANALLRAAQSVRLLGAQVILTGIRPEVAQTLVGLGTDLGGIVTQSSLQSGIAYAILSVKRRAG